MSELLRICTNITAHSSEKNAHDIEHALKGVCDIIRENGVRTLEEFHLISESFPYSPDDTNELLIEALSDYFVNLYLQKIEFSVEQLHIIEQLYEPFMFVSKNSNWIAIMDHLGFLKQIDVMRLYDLFEHSLPKEKYEAIFQHTPCLISEANRFGGQTYFFSILADSCNVPAWQAVGTSIKHLFQEQDINGTFNTAYCQNIILSVTTHIAANDWRGWRILDEILNETSVFNQSLPAEARIDKTKFWNEHNLLLTLPKNLQHIVPLVWDEQDIDTYDIQHHLSNGLNFLRWYLYTSDDDLNTHSDCDYSWEDLAETNTPDGTNMFLHFWNKLTLSEKVTTFLCSLGRLGDAQYTESFTNIAYIPHEKQYFLKHYPELDEQEQRVFLVAKQVLNLHQATFKEQMVLSVLKLLNITIEDIILHTNALPEAGTHQGIACSHWHVEMIRQLPSIQHTILLNQIDHNRKDKERRKI